MIQDRLEHSSDQEDFQLLLERKRQLWPNYSVTFGRDKEGHYPHHQQQQIYWVLFAREDVEVRGFRMNEIGILFPWGLHHGDWGDRPAGLQIP